MGRARVLAWCATFAALLTAGCAADAFRFALPGSGPGADDLVLPAPPRAAASAAADALRRMNLFASCGREGEEPRVGSASPAGRRFTLRFLPKKSEKRVETTVRIEWSGERDDAFWAQLQAALVAGPSPPPGVRAQ